MRKTDAMRAAVNAIKTAKLAEVKQENGTHVTVSISYKLGGVRRTAAYQEHNPRVVQPHSWLSSPQFIAWSITYDVIAAALRDEVLPVNTSDVIHTSVAKAVNDKDIKAALTKLAGRIRCRASKIFRSEETTRLVHTTYLKQLSYVVGQYATSCINMGCSPDDMKEAILRGFEKSLTSVVSATAFADSSEKKRGTRRSRA